MNKKIYKSFGRLLILPSLQMAELPHSVPLLGGLNEID